LSETAARIADSMMQEERSRTPAAFIAGAVVVALLVGGIVLLTRRTRPAEPAAEQRLPMGAAGEAYAKQIRFLDLKMSRAANFLNQEVTFVFGLVANDGARTIGEIEVTVEFRDAFNQVVLRDTRRVLGPRTAPLAPGQRREFQLGFEHVPADWNRQYPSLRVTGLLLE
jgi:hypothetical protein